MAGQGKFTGGPRKGQRTEYKEIAFKSIHEARWAAFFDSLNIDWEYEPGWYGDYLPDFYLPDFDEFVEVKPLGWETRVGSSDICWLKLREGIKRLKGDLVLVCGLPIFDPNGGIWKFFWAGRVKLQGWAGGGKPSLKEKGLQPGRGYVRGLTGRALLGKKIQWRISLRGEHQFNQNATILHY